MTPTPDNLTRLARILYDREPEPADYLGGGEAKVLGDAAARLATLTANNAQLAHGYFNIQMDAYNQTREWRKALEFYANANNYRKGAPWKLAQEALAAGLPAVAEKEEGGDDASKG